MQKQTQLAIIDGSIVGRLFWLDSAAFIVAQGVSLIAVINLIERVLRRCRQVRSSRVGVGSSSPRLPAGCGLQVF
jgi:hypothetical protein